MALAQSQWSASPSALDGLAAGAGRRAACVLVPAYNEAQNIAPLLRRIAADSACGSWAIDDIVVIASGCTDETVARAEGVRAEGLPVRVIVQERREGKASAINAGLDAARHDVIVLVSGDVMPAPGAVSALLSRLDDDTIGVVGARPVPLNDASTFTGYAAQLMWRLHHAISEAAGDNPKCGEMIAFRRRAGDLAIVPAIPLESAVDEVSVQALVQAAGLRSAYAGEAIVRNWGPSTLRDWFKQRRRINNGHVLAAREGYRPSTMGAGAVLRALRRDQAAWRRPHWLVAVMAIEVAARLMGRVDAARGREHAIWSVAATTKRAIGEEVV